MSRTLKSLRRDRLWVFIEKASTEPVIPHLHAESIQNTRKSAGTTHVPYIQFQMAKIKFP